MTNACGGRWDLVEDKDAVHCALEEVSVSSPISSVVFMLSSRVVGRVDSLRLRTLSLTRDESKS